MKRTVADIETTFYTLTRSIATFGEPVQPATTPYIHKIATNLVTGWRGGGLTQISKDSTETIKNNLGDSQVVDTLAKAVEDGKIGLLELLPLIGEPQKLTTSKKKIERLNLTDAQKRAVLYAILVASKDVICNAIAYLKATGIEGAESKYRAIAKNLTRELDEVKKGVEKGNLEDKG